MESRSTRDFGSVDHGEKQQFPVSMSSGSGIAMEELLLIVVGIPKVRLPPGFAAPCPFPPIPAPVQRDSRPDKSSLNLVPATLCREKDAPVQENALAGFHPFDLWSSWFKRCSSPLQTERR